MSTTETLTTICPNCEATLSAEGFRGVREVLCARCRTGFTGGLQGQSARTSRRATASLLLGLVSIVGLFFTGIPAIVLGILGLRDIRRQPDLLTGRGRAVTGIITGIVFGLLWGTCAGGIGAMTAGFVTGSKKTFVAAEVREIADSIGTFEAPEEILPYYAETLWMNHRYALFREESSRWNRNQRLPARPGQPPPSQTIKTRKPSGVLMIIQFQQQAYGVSSMPALRIQQARQQIRIHGSYGGGLKSVEERQHSFTINGEKIRVTERIGTFGSSSERIREYSATVFSGGAPVVLCVLTPEGPPDQTEEPAGDSENAPVRLTHEQVKRFFESFRPAD